VESRVGAMKIVLSTPLITALTAACIFFVLMLGMMPGQASNTGNAIDDVKGFHSNFIHRQEKSPVGQLVLPKDTIYFPWYGRDEIGAKCPACSAVPSGRPVKEDIRMKGSESKEQVQDLKAINSVKQRDIVYEEIQRGESDPQGLYNSMDIQIRGAEGDPEGEEYGCFGDSIENLVNSKLTASMNGANSETLASSREEVLAIT
jgi:hypothetical protein